MKTFCSILSAFMLVGCEHSQRSTLLTAEQATTLAMRLANHEAATLYQRQPFQGGQPARLMDGCWIWTDQQGFGHADIQALVQLAADGSTNSVEIKLLESQNQLPSILRR